MRRASPAEPSIAENASAGFDRWIDIFLCGHKRVFVVKRSRLREEFGGTHSGADGRIAQIQRYAELDVFPQFAHQRSLVHSALCSFHQPWPKRGGIARPSRGSARGLTAMQPVEQRDEVEMLSLMLLIRRFEERASQQYQAQKIGGFCHLYIGQEAVVTGAIAAMRDDDYIITAYRDHAHALARGTSANACMAELFGKETGCSRGLGGSMHFFDKQHHMYGGHAIVAAHVPLAVGMAFCHQIPWRRSCYTLLFR